MLEVVIGTALALAIRDLIYELIDRYQHYKHQQCDGDGHGDNGYGGLR